MTNNLQTRCNTNDIQSGFGAKVKTIGEKWGKLDHWLKRLISTVSSILVISGALIGAVSWVVHQANSQVTLVVEQQVAPLSAEVIELKEQVSDYARNSELSITRLELSNLISHNPTNVLEIEKVARHYFVELGGDWYMSQIYSDWAREYGGDLAFVTHK